MSLPLKFFQTCFLFSLFCINFASSERFDDCGKRAFTGGLTYGGKEAVLGQFPWHAALMLKGRNNKTMYFCGASVITPKHLLSAAHCFQQAKGSRIKKPESVKVLVGGVDLSDFGSGNWTALDVKNITLHPNWALEQGNYDADLAILELKSRLTFNQNIRRVCLPEPNQEVLGRNGTVVGYGLTENSIATSKVPKYIELTSKHTIDCVLNKPEYATVISRRMFCAGEPGTTACQGDSGSSFVELNDVKRFTVIGVVSSNIITTQTCDPNMPSAYTGIPSFANWIREIVQSELPDFVAELDSIPSRCTEPEVKGSCKNYEPKFYYDSTVKECRPFFYSGCGGNENRFNTMLECRNYCQCSENYRRCQKLIKECKTITCKYGHTKSNDPDTGCEKCACYNPCANHKCPKGQRCSVEQKSDDNEEKYVPKCREVSKPGYCPTSIPQNGGIYTFTCSDDADCSRNWKCCLYDSHSMCRLPVEVEEVPFRTFSPHKKAEKLTPQESLNASNVENSLSPGSSNASVTEGGLFPNILNTSKTEHKSDRQLLRGEKGDEGRWSKDPSKIYYFFTPFENATIDTKTCEIASDRDEEVLSFRAYNIAKLSYLPIKVDQVFPNLVSYSVNSCPLTEISAENFKNLKKIGTLYLQDNKISSIDKDAFKDLIALKMLFLVSNQLKSLHEDTFINNRALENIFLYGNKLESLPAKLLRNLSELKVITLGENKLKRLDVTFFKYNLKIEQISLERNQIDYLDGDIFNGLEMLNYVQLEGNKCISKVYGEHYEDLSDIWSDLARECPLSNV